MFDELLKKLASRRGLNQINDSNVITRQTYTTRAIESQWSFGGLANPKPVFAAVLSRSGRTVWYHCGYCGLMHRHRADKRLLAGQITSKQTHCRRSGRLDSVRLVLAGGRS